MLPNNTIPISIANVKRIWLFVLPTISIMIASINFGEYEGYVGNEKEFWFRKIVLNEVKCHENLRKIGICDNDIARSIKSATKFKRRFKGILTQLNVQTGIEEDLKKGCILQ